MPQPYPTEWVALSVEGDDEITAVMQAQLPLRSGPKFMPYCTNMRMRFSILPERVTNGLSAWCARSGAPRLGQVGLTARLDTVLTQPIWGTLVLLGVARGYLLGYLRPWRTLARVAECASGYLAAGVHQGLAAAPPWLVALIADGVIGGAGMVVTFLPILLIFFAALALL